MRPKIYISGPITKGYQSENLERSYDAHEDLIQIGCAPLNPILTCTVPFDYKISHETWLAIDKEWIRGADGLLRLDGTSKGADEEVEFAIGLGVPVFYVGDGWQDRMREFYGLGGVR